MNFVTISKNWNVEEAQLVRARLESAGFHPAIANEHSGREMLGGLGGIVVQVPENEAAEVKEFLAAADVPPEQP
jgi:hypothetical protein